MLQSSVSSESKKMSAYLNISFITYSLFLLLISADVYSQTLSNKEIQDIRGSVASSCFKTQRSRPINDIATDLQLRSYCTCYANSLISSSLTLETWHAAITAKKNSGDKKMMDVILNGRDLNTIANRCATKVFQ